MYEYYKQLKLPSYAPPGIAFYYAWMILYFLMLVSFIILLFLPKTILHLAGLVVFALQVFVNFLWPYVFFKWKKAGLSCVISFVLFVLVLFMTLIFFKLMPLLGWLQIPYVLWLVFASILNFDVYRLNKDD